MGTKRQVVRNFIIKELIFKLFITAAGELIKLIVLTDILSFGPKPVAIAAIIERKLPRIASSRSRYS